MCALNSAEDLAFLEESDVALLKLPMLAEENLSRCITLGMCTPPLVLEFADSLEDPEKPIQVPARNTVGLWRASHLLNMSVCTCFWHGQWTCNMPQLYMHVQLARQRQVTCSQDLLNKFGLGSCITLFWHEQLLNMKVRSSQLKPCAQTCTCISKYICVR